MKSTIKVSELADARFNEISGRQISSQELIRNSRRVKLESVPILRVLVRLKQLDCREKGPMSIAERLRIF